MLRRHGLHDADERVLVPKVFEGVIETLLLVELKDGVMKDPSKTGCNPPHILFTD